MDGIIDGDDYLNARVSVFVGKLLKEEQVRQLPQLSPEEIAKRYGISFLQDPQRQGLAPALFLRAVESALLGSLLDELTILVRPMDGDERKCVTQWARKFELFNLKALIRGKLSGLSDADIQSSLYDLPDYLSLPYQALLRSESVLEMLRVLERSGHRELAGHARKVYEERGDPFLLEAAIDHRYFSSMVEALALIDDVAEVGEVIGLQMDRVNLVLILRYRFTYQLPASEVYYQLASSPKHLSKSRMLDLLNCTTHEAMLAALPVPLNQELEGAQTTAEVERRMYTLYVQGLKKVLIYSSSGIARALAYLMLRELDIKRLFSVVQGHVLNLDSATISRAIGI